MNKLLKIPEDNIVSFTKKVNFLNRKAKKLGLKSISFTENKVIFEDKEFETSQGTIKNVVKYIEIEVIGELPQLPNWSYVGVVEHNDKMNIIHFLDSFDYDCWNHLEIYRTSKSICEHCNTNRRRNKTVIVQNKLTNEFKQVGTTCLNDFLGHNALTNFEYIQNIYNLEEYEEIIEKNYSNRFYTNSQNIIRLSYDYLKDNVFISKSKSSEVCKEPTSNIIEQKYFSGNFKVSEESKNFYKNCKKYIIDLESDNDYINNLKSLVINDYIESKYIGFLVSAVPFYNREMEKVTRWIDESKSKYIGEIKEKLTLNDVEYVNSIEFCGYYGTTYFHKFYYRSNVLIWASSKKLNLKCYQLYNIVGTVKKHEAYKNCKQTFITRCKIN